MISFVKYFAILTAMWMFFGVNPINAQSPNIVWIVSEDNSAEYLELYDNNGAKTPNIESLAEAGAVFLNAFSNAPVCSASRSTLISGSYGPRLASHYHRRAVYVPLEKGTKMFPTYLREAGYYTTNNDKEDYNFKKNEGVWDESSKEATWRNRSKDQPFFSVFNIGGTHERRLWRVKREMQRNNIITNPDSERINPKHPDTELFRFMGAYYRDLHLKMDEEVGDIVNQLKVEGLYDETFIFYFGDHGGALPGSKGYLNEQGLKIPLVMHIPEKYKHLVNIPESGQIERFVSFVDFGPTMMSLAGIKIPRQMDGIPFLGKYKAETETDETFGYADRINERYEMVRSIHKGNFKYKRNYQPFIPDALYNKNRDGSPAYREWKLLWQNDELNPLQAAYFERKPAEELYDLSTDKFETVNLANNPRYIDILKDLRSRLFQWQLSMPDLGFYPENYLIEQAFDNPALFGKKHKKDIKKYMQIANLQLSNFNQIENEIEKSLRSKDCWERYWALIVCSHFEKEAELLFPEIRELALSDKELLVRMRAIEFLAIIGEVSPQKQMLDCLYQSEQPQEALLILNSMVMLKDYGFLYQFEIDYNKISRRVVRNKDVALRLEYMHD